MHIPRSDVATEYLQPAPGSCLCEWKGTARYWTVCVAPVVLHAVGWSYDDPLPALDAIRARLSFYPAQIECYVDGVRVRGQAGGFYGGWVTPELVGPFKGVIGAQVTLNTEGNPHEPARALARSGSGGTGDLRLDAAIAKRRTLKDRELFIDAAGRHHALTLLLMDFSIAHRSGLIREGRARMVSTSGPEPQ